MHATADTLPMPANGPSPIAQWLKAHLAVAVLAPLTAGLLPVLLNKMPGLPVGSLTMAWLGSALAFFVVFANVAAYAILMSSVLGEKLPAFSRRAWIATHLVVAAALGGLFAIIAFQAGGDAGGIAGETKWSSALAASPGRINWIDSLVGSLIVMLPLALVVGGLQVLVLRRAASGMRAWIVSAMIGGLVAAALLFAIDLARHGQLGFGANIKMSILVSAGAFIWAVAMALVMLPAFNRLVPKN